MEHAYLANSKCARCGGAGTTGRRRETPCRCVCRAAARICIRRMQYVEMRGPHWHHHCWTRDAEFAAEIWLVARRVLRGAELAIFRRFLLADEPWYAVERETRLGRGQFFHAVYRTETRLGRALIGTPMFPPHRYLAGLRHAGTQIGR